MLSSRAGGKFDVTRSLSFAANCSVAGYGSGGCFTHIHSRKRSWEFVTVGTRQRGGLTWSTMSAGWSRGCT
jgi:hypothetical protein